MIRHTCLVDVIRTGSRSRSLSCDGELRFPCSGRSVVGGIHDSNTPISVPSKIAASSSGTQRLAHHRKCPTDAPSPGCGRRRLSGARRTVSSRMKFTETTIPEMISQRRHRICRELWQTSAPHKLVRERGGPPFKQIRKELE